MKPTKRQRKSGLSGIELLQTVTALKSLASMWRQEETEDPEEDTADVTIVEAVLGLLQTKLDGPQTHTFPNTTFDHLDKMKISNVGLLELKADAINRANTTDSIGEDEHWSAKGLFRHLCLLQGLVPRTNEAATRLWINAFFYRVSAMIPNGSKMVLSVEHTIAPVTESAQSFNTYSGFVDFTAIATTPKRANLLLGNLRLQDLAQEDAALFVSEAKGPDQRLPSHIPQAIGEMYACAKHAGKATIRGVLTNGHGWLFLNLRLNSDGNGGSYYQSEEISLFTLSKINPEAVSLISAIITHWIRHSHEEIDGDGDDYFVREA